MTDLRALPYMEAIPASALTTKLAIRREPPIPNCSITTPNIAGSSHRLENKHCDAIKDPAIANAKPKTKKPVAAILRQTGFEIRRRLLPKTCRTIKRQRAFRFALVLALRRALPARLTLATALTLALTRRLAGFAFAFAFVAFATFAM